MTEEKIEKEGNSMGKVEKRDVEKERCGERKKEKDGKMEKREKTGTIAPCPFPSDVTYRY